MLIHPINPLYDEQSEILILGSFPSVKSREVGFFYGHPQNRFWRVMARICGEQPPQTIEQKTKMILDHHFALWDVIRSCEIEGSADSTIKNVQPNDLRVIIRHAPVRKIFVNGKKAESLYRKYIEKDLGIVAVVLPSTSPANAAWSEDRLFEAWYRALKEEFSHDLCPNMHKSVNIYASNADLPKCDKKAVDKPGCFEL